MRSNDLMCTYHMTIVMCAVISKWGQHPAARQDYYALNPDLSLDMARGRHAGMCGTRLGRLLTSSSNQRVCTDRGAGPAGNRKEEGRAEIGDGLATRSDDGAESDNLRRRVKNCFWRQCRAISFFRLGAICHVSCTQQTSQWIGPDPMLCLGRMVSGADEVELPRVILRCRPVVVKRHAHFVEPRQVEYSQCSINLLYIQGLPIADIQRVP
jgi:hypothetical protein